MSVAGVPNSVHRWFGSVTLPPPILPGAQAVINELVAMLGVLDPQFVDRGRSSIGVKGRIRGGRIVTVLIAHVSDPLATVNVDVFGAGAVVGWLGTHEHIDAADGSPGRPWTSIVVDVVAAALRGEYEVERVHRGRLLVRTRIRDAARDGAVISETGSLLSWVPLGRSSKEVQRLDFGVER